MSFIINNNIYELKDLPKMDKILDDENIKEYISIYSYKLVKKNIEEVLNIIRKKIKHDKVHKLDFLYLEKSKEDILKSYMLENIRLNLISLMDYKLKKVINATGIVLHTNLGRAILSDDILDRISKLAGSYTNIEYDIKKFKRGDRNDIVSTYLKYILECEEALVVNNNAAAMLLILNTFARRKEVIVSRGELVEIGGSFRIPEIMSISGAKLIEVGTTNKTHEYDYINAINEKTKILLKVHTSNYLINGFTSDVSIYDLNKISKKSNKLLVYDIGSGLLKKEYIRHKHNEPSVYEALEAGADLVCFSGDKLLGASQAGIIVGKKMYIDKIKKNPLLRALRVDKLNIISLETTLQQYLNENKINNIPIYKMINKSEDELKSDAIELFNTINKEVRDTKGINEIKIEKTSSLVGGGSMPELSLVGYGVYIRHNNLSKLAKKLSTYKYPIITRIYKDYIIFDVRTIKREEYMLIAKALQTILKEV